MFDKFDRPDPAMSCPRREITTVVPQALWTLNNEVSYEQARQLAVRLVKQSRDDPSAWVNALWRIAFARQPSAKEAEEALSLLEKLAIEAKQKKNEEAQAEIASLEPARETALLQLCLSIFNLNEFIFID